MGKFISENLIRARKGKRLEEEQEREFYEPVCKRMLEMEDEVGGNMALPTTMVMAITSNQKPRRRSLNQDEARLLQHKAIKALQI